MVEKERNVRNVGGLGSVRTGEGAHYVKNVEEAVFVSMVGKGGGVRLVAGPVYVSMGGRGANVASAVVGVYVSMAERDGVARLVEVLEYAAMVECGPSVRNAESR